MKWQTDRVADRQTDRQTDRQAGSRKLVGLQDRNDRRTDRHRQTDIDRGCLTCRTEMMGAYVEGRPMPSCCRVFTSWASV